MTRAPRKRSAVPNGASRTAAFSAARRAHSPTSDAPCRLPPRPRERSRRAARIASPTPSSKSAASTTRSAFHPQVPPARRACALPRRGPPPYPRLCRRGPASGTPRSRPQFAGEPAHREPPDPPHPGALAPRCDAPDTACRLLQSTRFPSTTTSDRIPRASSQPGVAPRLGATGDTTPRGVAPAGTAWFRGRGGQRPHGASCEQVAQRFTPSQSGPDTSCHDLVPLPAGAAEQSVSPSP